MRVQRWLAAVVLAGCTGVGVAQMGAEAKVAVGSPMDPAKAEDAMLSAFEHELTGVAEAMPADKYSFAPTDKTVAGSKYDGVRSFSAELTHVIQANYYFFSTVAGTKPDVDMSSFKTMTSKDQILPALAASFKYAHKAIATITPANAFTTIDGADGMHTRATVASFAVAHGFDHYGQMVEYLRMNGVTPPGSK